MMEELERHAVPLGDKSALQLRFEEQLHDKLLALEMKIVTLDCLPRHLHVLVP